MLVEALPFERTLELEEVYAEKGVLRIGVITGMRLRQCIFQLPYAGREHRNFVVKLLRICKNEAERAMRAISSGLGVHTGCPCL